MLLIFVIIILIITSHSVLSYGDYSPGKTDYSHEKYYSTHERVSQNGRSYYTIKDSAKVYSKNYYVDSNNQPRNVNIHSSDSNTRHGYGAVIDTAAGRTIYSYNSKGYGTATSNTNYMRASDYVKSDYGTYHANYYRTTPYDSDYYYSGNTKYVKSDYGATGSSYSNSYTSGNSNLQYVKTGYGTGNSKSSYSGNYAKIGNTGYGNPDDWEYNAEDYWDYYKDQTQFYGKVPYGNQKYKTYSIPVAMKSNNYNNVNTKYYYTKTYKYNRKSYDYDSMPFN